MISTGIAELDQRLGGLTPGRYYLLTGTPGAGKTSASLHFLNEGLKNGETCAILSQENPDDLFAQAQFLGTDFEEAAGSDSLFIFQYRLDFSTNYGRVGNPRAVARELVNLLGDKRPTRLVVDSILPFVQAGGITHGAVSALLHIMEELEPTCYFIVPGDLGDSFYARLYDPIVSGAAGIFHFEMHQGIRELTIRKIRQPPTSTAPLRFVIRSGVGIIEYADGPVTPIPEEVQRRVALINTGGRVGGDFFASLRLTYELETYQSLEEADAATIRDSFGALLIALDPLAPERAFAFVQTLRKMGNGVPVVMIARSEGLRASTRGKGMRAGADEFVTLDASPQEFIAKIEAARHRGPRSTAERLRVETLLVQPRDEQNQPLPIAEDELVRAVRQHLSTPPHPFFAIVSMRPAPGNEKVLWDALVAKLRVADGDLIACAPTGEWLLYLHDISRRHVVELLDRLLDANPQLTPPSSMRVQHYPADAAAIEAWLSASENTLQPMRAHG